MPRFAPMMSVEDFKSTLVSAALKNDYENEYKKLDPTNPNWEDICVFLHGHTTEIAKDWEKVEFDTENMQLEEFDSTPSGVPYVRMLCGGDWEEPVHAIIYFDGKKFRGYVPTKGNTFNPKTKVAYGNEDDDVENDDDIEDAILARSNYPKVDYASLKLDIASRIEAKGTCGAVDFGKSVFKIAVESETKLDGEDVDVNSLIYFRLYRSSDGSYIVAFMKSSKRELTSDEADLVQNIPMDFKKNNNENCWRTNYYPIKANNHLEAAGFEVEKYF